MCSFLQAQEEEQLVGEAQEISPTKEAGHSKENLSTEKVPEAPVVSEKNDTELPTLEVKEVSVNHFSKAPFC